MRGKICIKEQHGLLNEKQFKKKLEFTQIHRYREQGLIKPVGKALSGNNLSCFYHQRQIKKLRKDLGVTLKNIKGLLVERQFALEVKLDKNTIKKFREKGVIKPVGTYITTGGLSNFYRRFQIAELKNKLKNK